GRLARHALPPCGRALAPPARHRNRARRRRRATTPPPRRAPHAPHREHRGWRARRRLLEVGELRADRPAPHGEGPLAAYGCPSGGPIVEASGPNRSTYMSLSARQSGLPSDDVSSSADWSRSMHTCQPAVSRAPLPTSVIVSLNSSTV